MYKLLTIITVAYNAEKTIEKTILSIIRVKNKIHNIEYIIIDGNSTDKTVDIIKKYDNYIDCWISEKDRGIYDAMNKGIDKAHGQYIIFLGADDVLLSIPNKVLKEALINDIKAVIGNVLLSNGKIFSSKFSKKLIYKNTIHHQGLFLKTDILKKYHFNIKYKIYADHDLNQKLYKEKITWIKTNAIVTRFNVDGISKNERNNEIIHMTYHNFGIVGMVVCILRFLMRKMYIRLKEFINIINV